MSEIFSWLKKTELERRKIVPEVFQRAVEVAEEEEEQLQDVPIPPSPLESAGVPDIRVRADARFDLAAADYRIKSVFDPLTVVGEQYRLLRAKLSLTQRQQGAKTFLVTSSVADEGKTFTACSLAGVFAQEPGKRVLLIDGDMRRPKAARDLGLANAHQVAGLSQILRGDAKVEDVLLSSSNLNFFLLPAGPVPPDPVELLSSPLLEQTIQSMRSAFDWVVVDSPPVLALADSTLLASVCDMVLLIVRTDKTSSKLIKEAVNRLGSDKICGVVMNRGKRLESTRYYSHYYRGSQTPR